MIGKLMHFLRAARLALLTLGLALLPSLSSAVYFPVALEHGKVFARTLVKGPSGYPVFVVYDERGEISQEIGEAVGELQDALIMSRGAYNTYAEELNRILQDRDGVGRGATVMTREAYENYEFLTVDDKPVTNKPSLRPDSTSVLVRSKERLLAPDQSPILLQAPFNLYNAVPLDASIRSLLVNKQGETVTTSTGNIGLKAELYRDPETRREPLGPIPYVFVEGSMIALGGTPGSMTDRQGRYSFSYLLPPCPGFTFEYTSPLFARLYYKNFNPRGQRFGTYHIQRTNYHFCNGIADVAPGLTLGGLMAQIDAMAMRAAAAVPIYPINFPVDVYLITGNARLANCVPPEHPDSCSRWVATGDGTRYEYQTPDTSPIIHLYDENGDGTPDEGYDFDGDDKPDLIVRGDLQRNPETGKETFVVNPEGTLQGVYLSAGGRSPTAELEESRQPDFTRALDRRADFEHKGLLSSITADDLKKTDLYVFRESNGQLVTERKGLKDEEVQTVFNDGGLDENGSGQMYYKVLIRGRGDAGNSMRGDFEGWQQRSKMEPEFYRRDSDHLRPGEKVRVILINRPTGYIGAVTTEIRGADLDFNQLISLRIPEIRLAPPNLSVQVKRRQTIEHGLTRDEEREYLIGFEGGASSTDSVIEVSTEWYDHDGRPLPEGLGEFGYTGRLAKVVGANELAPEGGELANFRIRPGRHQQVIRVKDNAITREHFYLHIAGDPPDRNPDFSTLGAGDGPLAVRPAHYTPFKVAVFDEKTTIVARNAWRRAREEGDVTGRFPEPIYKWLYRPEMQFSLFDLSMQQILHGRENEDGTNILTAETPGLSNIDNWVSLSYNLLANDLEPLPLLGGQRELIFAVGEQELRATMGQDQQLRFTNLQHLASLKPEDFLTMRLYFNHDPENVLWQFAFEYLNLDTVVIGSPAQGTGVFRLSADEPQLPMAAWLVGYGSRDPRYKSPKTLRWTARGAGAIFDNQQADQENGFFTSTVRMPTLAGSRATIVATLQGNPDLVSEWGEVVVVPGKPDRMSVAVDGEMYIEGYKHFTATIKAWDRHGNKVANGTSLEYSLVGPVNIVSKDDAFINGEAKIVLSGGSLVDPEAKMTIVVSSLREEVPLEVKPLRVTWQNHPGTFATKQTYDLSVKVETESGEPAAGVDVIFDGTFGKFERGVPQTGADGVARIRFYSGFFETEGHLSARVGLQLAQKVEGNSAPIVPQTADTSKTILVGDSTTDGVAEYERYDGVIIGLPYKAKANIALNGEVGSNHVLTLGSLTEPNRAPIAAYFLNELYGQIAPDETGLHEGRAEDIVLSTEHPLGVGTSYAFSTGSKLQVVANPALQPSDGLGFRIDVKANAAGEILKLSAGSHKLVLTDDRRFVFSVSTSGGVVQISSSQVELNQWHSVAGRVLNGVLELEINGVAVAPVPTPAELAYGFGIGIELGGFEGNLSGFSLYDWRSAPLVRFSANGQENLNVVINAEESSRLVAVESSGQMNALQRDSALRTLRVGLQLGTEQQYISLVGKDFFGALMGTYYSQHSTAPPVVAAGVQRYKPIPVWDTVFPVAHAGVLDWIAENAWDAFTATIGVLIPFNEARGLFEQIGYMMDGEWDRVNYVTLTLDAIGVLTFIPVAKPLKLILTPLRRFIGPLGNKPFIKAIGGIIAKYADKIRKGKFDDLYKLVPYFLIVGELAADEEGREALMAMVDSIGSADDFLVWVDYLSLPALGWDGDGEPPAVDTEGAPVDDPIASLDAQFFSDQPQLLDAAMPRAYAAQASIARAGGKLLKKFLKGALRTKAVRQDPTQLTKVMKALRESFLDGGSRSIRQLAFNPRLMISALRRELGESAAGVTALLTGKSNARLHHGVIIGLFAYLEDRMSDCAISRELGMEALCKPIPEFGLVPLQHGRDASPRKSELHKEINKLIGKVILQASKKASGELTEEDAEEGDQNELTAWVHPFGQGALWHLFMIAVHHAKYEATGELPIVAIERLVMIELYESQSRTGELKPYTTLDNGKPQRWTDIELYTGDDRLTKWIEVKSQANTTNSELHECKWRKWYLAGSDPQEAACKTKNGGKKTAHYSKQFFMDLRAMAGFENNKRYAADIDWWLQKFKTKAKTFKKKGQTYSFASESSYSPALFDKTVGYLQVLPDPAAKAKLNLKGLVQQRDKELTRNLVESKFHMFSAVALVRDDFRDRLAQGLPEELLNEIFSEED